MINRDIYNIGLIYEMSPYKRSNKSYIRDIIDAFEIDNDDFNYNYNDDDHNDHNDYWRDELIGITTVDDEETADRLQKQYESAIGRTSNYVGDLYSHILSHNGLVLFDDKNESAVVGYSSPIRGGRVFIVSHFAPYSLRSGVNFIRYLANLKHPIVMAVPDYQSNQLLKAGFRKVGSIPQHFGGELVMKNVMVNDNADDQKLKELMNLYGNNQ